MDGDSFGHVRINSFRVQRVQPIIWIQYFKIQLPGRDGCAGQVHFVHDFGVHQGIIVVHKVLPVVDFLDFYIAVWRICFDGGDPQAVIAVHMIVHKRGLLVVIGHRYGRYNRAFRAYPVHFKIRQVGSLVKADCHPDTAMGIFHRGRKHRGGRESPVRPGHNA